ncbi:hypothetical protein D3C72_1151210 [compost metagenome]
MAAIERRKRTNAQAGSLLAGGVQRRSARIGIADRLCAACDQKFPRTHAWICYWQPEERTIAGACSSAKRFNIIHGVACCLYDAFVQIQRTGRHYRRNADCRKKTCGSGNDDRNVREHVGDPDKTDRRKDDPSLPARSEGKGTASI